MATPHKVIITGKTGPASQVTALNILDVESVTLDLVAKTMLVEVDQSIAAVPPNADGRSDNIKEYDIATIASVTTAIAAGAFTITVVA